MQIDYAKPGVPVRCLNDAELKAYADNGAICARGLVDRSSIEGLREALEDALVKLQVFDKTQDREDDGFRGDVFVWKLHDAFRDFALFSSLPALAQQVLGTETVNFFYEQFFVKRAGSPIETPWHQDIPFWPVEGSQIVSFWITLDPVTRKSSGLEFVRGSHRWSTRYKAVTPKYDGYLADSDMPEAPDYSQLKDDYDVIGWDMEPGDVIVFGPTVMHGSAGNASNERDRRAMAFRYCGQDVRYAPRHAAMPLLFKHGLKPGDALGGSLFPRVWPSVIDIEIAGRMAGPELPDGANVAAFREHLVAHGFGPGGTKKSIFFNT